MAGLLTWRHNKMSSKHNKQAGHLEPQESQEIEPQNVQAPTRPMSGLLVSLPPKGEKGESGEKAIEQSGIVYVALYRKNASRTVSGIPDKSFAALETSTGPMDLRGSWESVCESLGLPPGEVDEDTKKAKRSPTRAIVGASLPGILKRWLELEAIVSSQQAK